MREFDGYGGLAHPAEPLERLRQGLSRQDSGDLA